MHNISSNATTNNDLKKVPSLEGILYIFYALYLKSISQKKRIEKVPSREGVGGVLFFAIK